MIKWLNCITVITFLTINLVTGQLTNHNDYPANIAIEHQQKHQQSTSTNNNGHNQIGLITTPSFDDNINNINQIKSGPLTLDQHNHHHQQQQQQSIKTNLVTRSSTNTVNQQNETSVQHQQSTAIKSQTKSDGEYKTLQEILNLAGLSNIESLVPTSEPKSFMIKTRMKTTETESDKEEAEEKEEEEEEEEEEEKEEKEVKKTTKKKTSKKTSKKSKKKSTKKKTKKKKSCGCCCCK